MNEERKRSLFDGLNGGHFHQRNGSSGDAKIDMKEETTYTSSQEDLKRAQHDTILKRIPTNSEATTVLVCSNFQSIIRSSKLNEISSRLVPLIFWSNQPLHSFVSQKDVLCHQLRKFRFRFVSCLSFSAQRQPTWIIMKSVAQLPPSCQTDIFTTLPTKPTTEENFCQPSMNSWTIPLFYRQVRKRFSTNHNDLQVFVS